MPDKPKQTPYMIGYTASDLVIARSLAGSSIERVAEVIAAMREQGRREILDFGAMSECLAKLQ
jgi:hypothetical protein